MSKMFADVQPAVRKETKKVAIGTFVCVVLMWAVFGIGHLAVPEQIPFDYTVLLAGFIGGMVAVLNFFLMGLTEDSFHGGRQTGRSEDEGQL